MNKKEFFRERLRLLYMQEQLEKGIIKEEDLDENDVLLLKDLYCDQILELIDSIEETQKKLNELKK